MVGMSREAARHGRAVLAVVLAAALLGACARGNAEVEAVRPDLRQLPDPTTTTTARAPRPVAAHATLAEVPAFANPGDAVPAMTLANPTHEGVPLVMFVREQQGEWLKVQIPRRPNGTTTWVKVGDVALTEMATNVVVSLGERRLRVFDADGIAVVDEPVAIGKPETPTPVGEFYIDAIVENPGSPYGAWQLSVAGFSDVLMRFAGGNGQIAIHGWHDPSVVGKNVSNGCIRMPDDAVTRVAQRVGLGTPVSIVA